MAIVVRLDVMLAMRKMKSKELAEAIGMAEQNVSMLRQGKVKGIRFDTLEPGLSKTNNRIENNAFATKRGSSDAVLSSNIDDAFKEGWDN